MSSRTLKFYGSHTVALISLRIVAKSGRAVERNAGRRRRRSHLGRRHSSGLLLIADDVQTFVAASRVEADLRINVARHLVRLALVDVLALGAAGVQDVARRTVPGCEKVVVADE